MIRGRKFLEALPPEDGLPINDKAVAEIRLLSAIAKTNGSVLSLRDIATLTNTDLTEAQLKAAWPANSRLASLYELADGYVLERERSEKVHARVLDGEREKRARAKSYTDFANEFASFLKGGESCLVAISGSTSYQTVSEKDDLDLFCITRPESLWIFLTKTLLLSRFFRMSRKNAPRICFSYAVDQSYAEKDFATSHDPLFARDALTTRVIHGRRFYLRLLERSSWISRFFPQLYQQRTNTSGVIEEPRENDAHSSQSPFQNLLNLLLFHLVGNYIALKSSMLNRKFRQCGMSSSLFTVKLGPDHCIFESNRYSRLRGMYEPFNTRFSRNS